MGLAVANLVRETTTSTGSSNLTLVVKSGYASFDIAFSHGATTNVFYYFIIDETNNAWEYGKGHMSDATTLVRDTVILSSSGIATAITFAAGTKTIICDVPAEYRKLIFYNSKSADYSIAANDETIELTSGTHTFTFPDATTLTPGKEFFIKNSGTGVLSWATTSSQTVDGLTTGTAGMAGGGQYSAMTVIANGANYIIKG